jgi:hypothetical protein
MMMHYALTFVVAGGVVTATVVDDDAVDVNLPVHFDQVLPAISHIGNDSTTSAHFVNKN